MTELHEIGTQSHGRFHLYPTRTSGARNVLRHDIPELLDEIPEYLIELRPIIYILSIYLPPNQLLLGWFIQL